MNAWFDRLNLSALERRWAIAGMLVLVLLVNWIFVWPYFNEWTPTSVQLVKFRQQIATHSSEVGKAPSYKQRILELQGSGASVLPADQANSMMQKIQTQANSSQINLQSVVPVGGRGRFGSTVRTNDFFDEQIMRVKLTAGERELVDFLYSLGSGDSTIRVRNISNLRLDPSAQKLQADVDLVAMFQKKPPTPAVAAPVRSPASTNSKVNATTVQSKGPLPSTNKPSKK